MNKVLRNFRKLGIIPSDSSEAPEPPKLTREQELAAYYKSDRWQELRAQRLEMDGEECVLCTETENLQVHHRRYPELLGTESVKDLITLCADCHHNYHSPPGLRETQEEFHQKLHEGDQLTCPVCDQNCKVYKRKLNSGMAAALCWLVRVFDGGWIDVPSDAPRFVLRTKEYGTVRHWGLIEQRPNDDNPSKKESGLWMPTEEGIAFAKGQIRVPKHVYLYNNKPLQFSDEDTNIVEALGDKFDYAELMQPTPTT